MLASRRSSSALGGDRTRTPFRARLLRPACIPVPPRAHSTDGRICTGTERVLRALPLLVGLRRHEKESGTNEWIRTTTGHGLNVLPLPSWATLASLADPETGLEPVQAAPKAAVLPLDDSGTAEDGRLERHGADPTFWLAPSPRASRVRLPKKGLRSTGQRVRGPSGASHPGHTAAERRQRKEESSNPSGCPPQRLRCAPGPCPVLLPLAEGDRVERSGRSPCARSSKPVDLPGPHPPRKRPDSNRSAYAPQRFPTAPRPCRVSLPNESKASSPVRNRTAQPSL